MKKIKYKKRIENTESSDDFKGWQQKRFHPDFRTGFGPRSSTLSDPASKIKPYAPVFPLVISPQKWKAHISDDATRRAGQDLRPDYTPSKWGIGKGRHKRTEGGGEGGQRSFAPSPPFWTFVQDFTKIYLVVFFSIFDPPLSLAPRTHFEFLCTPLKVGSRTIKMTAERDFIKSNISKSLSISITYIKFILDM